MLITLQLQAFRVSHACVRTKVLDQDLLGYLPDIVIWNFCLTGGHDGTVIVPLVNG